MKRKVSTRRVYGLEIGKNGTFLNDNYSELNKFMTNFAEDLDEIASD